MQEFLNLLCPVAQDHKSLQFHLNIYLGMWHPAVFSNMKSKGHFFFKFSLHNFYQSKYFSMYINQQDAQNSCD